MCRLLRQTCRLFAVTVILTTTGMYSILQSSTWKTVVLARGLWEMVTTNCTRLADQAERRTDRKCTAAQPLASNCALNSISAEVSAAGAPHTSVTARFLQLAAAMNAAATKEGSAAIVHITRELLGVHLTGPQARTRLTISSHS